MTLYLYRAMDRQGSVFAGKLEAMSMDSALARLSGDGLLPMDIRPGSPWRQLTRRPLFAGKKLDRRELLDITQQLDALMHAGLHTDRALGIVEKLSSRRALRATVGRVLARIRAGTSLAEALAAEGDSVPGYYLSLVKAGELAGALPDTFGRLSVLLARSQEVRERVRSALIYPCILAGMVLVTIVLLLTIVLPRFEALFAASQVQLPISTRMVLALGTFLSTYGWALLVFIPFAAAGTWQALQSPRYRKALDTWLLRSKLTLELPARLETGRFLRTLGTLAGNGMPLSSAMRVALESLSNRALHESAAKVLLRLKEGESISRLLEESRNFPRLAAQLARVGEETGRLPEMLVRAADLLEGEAQRTIEKLLSMMIPAVTIAMGLIVAALIGSMLVGILSVNDLAF